MRITFLTHFPGPGGSTNHLVQLESFFRTRGHEVSVLAGQDHAQPVLQNYTVVAPAKNWQERAAKYTQAVESTCPDVVYSISGREEMSLLRHLRYPRLQHVFSLEQHEFIDIPFLIQQLNGFVEALTANTPDVLTELERRGRLRAAKWLSPYRVESGFVAEPFERETRTTPQRRVKIAFVGRLESTQKQAHWLPEIISGCAEIGLPLVWDIYGDGPCRSFIEQRLKENDCAHHARFHGWVDSSKLPELLRGQDIFFLCSRWEGLPVAMLEAMMCGVACVTPEIRSGISYMLEQGGGWMYEATSPASAVQALSAAVRDRAVLERKKNEARQIALQCFNPAQVEESLLLLEENMVKLRFNGHFIPVRSSRRLWPVRPGVYLNRLLRRAIPIRKWPC